MLTLTLVAAGNVSSASGAARSCANVPGADVIQATNTTCREAHKVIRLWLAGYERDGKVNRRVSKWSCRVSVNSVEGEVATCRKGRGQRIGWYVNIPR
ncbi:MAG: hypothetical protein JHC95_12245 [Solirubrobacteraceae bacterium]|nr:hypothetical protein [Solirubrobacteraceae bacterium]